MRGILNTIIQSLFSEIIGSQEGWPLARVATYRGTTVFLYIHYIIALSSDLSLKPCVGP